MRKHPVEWLTDPLPDGFTLNCPMKLAQARRAGGDAIQTLRMIVCAHKHYPKRPLLTLGPKPKRERPTSPYHRPSNHFPLPDGEPA